MRDAPVVLVVPPFRSVLLPALGPSLLKANLLRDGARVELLYLNVKFADRVGARRYSRIEPQVFLSTGDFVFSCVRFSKGREDIERYVREILLPSEEGRVLSRLLSPRKLVNAVAELAREADEFCRDSVDEILALGPWLVGFSSSVQENLASLALAQFIKQRDPSVRTILGGPNTQAEMGRELFARFPELDYVGQGECDLSLLELVREHREGRPPAPIAGILRRDTDLAPPPPDCLSAAQLESCPIPDFGDYFRCLTELEHSEDIRPGIIVESSRGCWWGAKEPCPFCGVAGENWTARSKSPVRAVQEINELVERHGVRDVWLADLMLDLRGPSNLLTALAEHPVAQFFCETSGALTKEQVRLLAEARVLHTQPGIESLSDASLKLLHKPTTTLRNLQTLKWCGEVGIRTYWNYLCGMPGESDDELDSIEDLVRAVHHLAPPSEAHLVRVQRFSRYFATLEDGEFATWRAASFYRHLYPFAEDSLQRLAYHFEVEHIAKRAESEGYGRLSGIMEEWRRQHRRSRLDLVTGRRGSWVLDTRTCARSRLRKLRGLELAVLLACDEGKTLPELLETLPAATPGEEARATLGALLRDRVVLNLEGRFLSLVQRKQRHARAGGSFGGQEGRAAALELLRIARSLHLSPLDLTRFASRSLPSAFSLAVRGISMLRWGAFSWVGKRLIGDRGEAG